jgi:LmbE family N-acetylglucosaminyl deacetylase
VFHVAPGTRVLVVAPHPDDETIAMGGTIAKLATAGAAVTVAVATGAGEGEHPFIAPEAFTTVHAEAAEAHRILGVTETIYGNLPAVGVAEVPLWERNAEMDRLVQEVQPELLFCPFPYDVHVDHRELFHALTVAWRPVNDTARAIRAILCYEVLSETHWNAPYLEPGFLPTVACDITETLPTKLRALDAYASQIPDPPHARARQTIEALAHLRGGQFGMHAAEGFVLVRATF